MKNALFEFFLIAIGLGLLGIVVIFGWRNIQANKEQAENAQNNITGVFAEIENSEFTRYKDTSISGSELLNLIKRYDGSNYGILVTINAGTSTTTCYCKGIANPTANGISQYNDGRSLGTIADARDISKTSVYINPTKSFTGSVLYDAAGNIIGLSFTLNN